MPRSLYAVVLLLALRSFALGQEPPPPLKPLPLPENLLPDFSAPRQKIPALSKESPLSVPEYPRLEPAGGPTLPGLSGEKPSLPANDIKPGGSPVVVRATEMPPSSQAAHVGVEIIAPENSNIGAPVIHEIVVRNVGKAPVYQVRVEQEIPPGTRYLGGEPRAEYPGERLQWNLGIVDPGAEKRIKVQLQSNTEGDLQTRATVTYSTGCASVTRLTRPKLAVSISGPESVLVGEPATFQIRLSNTGTGAIEKLVLRDRLPAGLEHPQGSLLEAAVAGLRPGETRTVSLKTTAIKVGHYIHEIEAIADGQSVVQQAGGTPNPDLQATARTEVSVVEPGLQLRLTGPRVCLVKCEGVLSIDLTNPGTAPTRNIRLQARVPDGTESIGLSDEGSYDQTTRIASWTVAALEPGAHRVLTVKIRGTVLGDTSSVALAQSDGGLTAKAELPLRIEGVPALSLEVVDLDDPAPVDSDATYEIRVLNQGTCPCTGIQIVALMPEGMELREAQAPAPYRVQGQQVQFAPFARLTTKADLVYRIKVRSRTAGDVRFRVQLMCDQLQQPVLKEESSRFYKP